MAEFKKYAKILIQLEGGYTNHPDDLGGPTNFGITLKTYQQYCGQNKTIKDLRNMSYGTWEEIMKDLYWDKCRADEIENQSVAEIVVDWCVNSGMVGLRKVQEIAGTKPDGISGPKTLAAINGEMPDRIPNYTPTVACETASRLLGRTVATGTASMWFAEAKAGVQGAAALEDFEAKIDEDLLDLAEYLQADVIRKGWRHGRIPTRQLDEYSMLYGDPDGIWERWEFNPAAQSYGMVETNAAPAEPEDWPERARAAIAALPRTVETIRETLGSWEESMQKRVGDRYLVAGTGGSFSCGVDEASLMACLLEPGAVADLLDCQLEIAKASVDAAAARGIRVITGGGDCADNSGLLYSPDFFREVQTPRLTEFSRYC